MLQISHISKTFNPGTVNEKKALNGVDLHLDDGDFVTILGSNGAGKSTLFGAIAGSFVVDEGTIRLDGQNITNLPDFKRSKFIGRLFQDPLKGTAPSMTIEENLALAYLRASEKRSPFSVVTAKDRAGFREKLAQLELGLEDRMDHPVGLLSGGQRQALTLLMATLVTPKLLLLDEHTAALDPATAEKVLALTKKIVAENHITCLMITHNIPSALSLGNRTIMMNNGRIVLELAGAERENMTTEQLLKVFHEQGVSSDRILFSAVIFCAAEFDALARPLEKDDYVLAADGGLKHTRKLGIEPNETIGDFDSLGFTPPGAEIFPVEKDDTDAMLAVRRGLELGYREFLLYGSLDGPRLDHTVANFQTLQFLADRGAVGYLVGNRSIVTVVKNGSIAFPAGLSGNLSVFCMGADARGVTERGLYYTLEDGVLTSGFPLGVSNHFTGEPAHISVRDGSLLVIWDKAAGFPEPAK